MKHTVIKAMNIKPGMLIDITNDSRSPDISLITATEGKVKVQYTHFTLHDTYCEGLIGTIVGEKLVDVITGEKRKELIQKCLDGAYKRYFNARDDINTIRLIQAMDESTK